jgi:hypothetical protein
MAMGTSLCGVMKFLAKGLDVETDRGSNVGHRLLVTVSLAHDHPF